MLVIVSGLSGSGKSVALRILEDMGYYCIDNLPAQLFPSIATTLIKDYHHSAISLDVRNIPESSEELSQVLDTIMNLNSETCLLFFTAETSVLIRRYSDSRRKHPLSRKHFSLEDGIEQEKQTLAPIEAKANLIINTSSLSVHELSTLLKDQLPYAEKNDFTITFHSFGFKYGIPAHTDYVFDVRFLPNPHWDTKLRSFTGLDTPVIDFLQAQELVNTFIEQTEQYLEKWLPYLEQNNRSYLNIAIGCTGGQHRSVYVAEQLAHYFAEKGKNVSIKHHTLEKNKHKK